MMEYSVVFAGVWYGGTVRRVDRNNAKKMQGGKNCEKRGGIKIGDGESDASQVPPELLRRRGIFGQSKPSTAGSSGFPCLF
jgi:hypothetical protein